MTSDDIILMAREAGIVSVQAAGGDGTWRESMEAMERFHALAVAAEREACIQLIQAAIDHAHSNNTRLAPSFGKRQGATAVRVESLGAVIEAIRARSNT